MLHRRKEGSVTTADRLNAGEEKAVEGGDIGPGGERKFRYGRSRNRRRPKIPSRNRGSRI